MQPHNSQFCFVFFATYSHIVSVYIRWISTSLHSLFIVFTKWASAISTRRLTQCGEKWDILTRFHRHFTLIINAIITGLTVHY